MKLVMEVDSNELKRAVEHQVSAEISSISTSLIQEKIDQILPTKFVRVDEEMIRDEIRKYLERNISITSLRTYVSEAVLGECKNLIRKAF